MWDQQGFRPKYPLHIGREEELQTLWLSLNTQHRAAHVRHLSGGKSSKWKKGQHVSACVPQCSI